MSADPPLETQLRTRWRSLPGAGTMAGLGEELLVRWAEPQRHYHDQRHLFEVLDALDQLSADVPLEVWLAAWFHDAVHDGRPDDEQRSADLAARLLGPSPSVDEVVRLVLLTATHDPAPDDHGGELLCDADLAILAAAPERYAAYAADVRAEYAHVSDADFARGRADVLRGLIAPERIYRTPVGREWEPQARANVTAELTQLAHP